MRELAKRLKAVFFDLDETLLDDGRSMRRAAVRTCVSLGEGHADIDAQRLERTYLKVSEETWGALSSVPRASGSPVSSGAQVRLQVWGEALARCGLSSRALAEEAARIYNLERRNTYSLFPETEEVLAALRPRFKLGIITNGTGDVQHEKVRITGLEGYIDVLLVSGEVGVGKPDARIFMKALEPVGVAPGEALYVGDSLVFDVAGAKGAGMYAAWVNRAGLPRQQEMPAPDIEVSSLKELLPLLVPAAQGTPCLPLDPSLGPF